MLDPSAIHNLGQELIKGRRVSGVALLNEENSSAPARAPKNLDYDPYQYVEILGYKQRPGGLAYILLEQMVRRAPAIQAVVLTRITQVAAFCRPQEDSHQIGFKIVHRDKKRNLSRVAQREAERIQSAILHTTFGEPGIGRPTFEGFTKRYMRDSLTFDQGNFEIIPTRRGKPYSWHVVDAKTIRLIDTDERFLHADSNNKPRTVQILDDRRIAEWPANELAFCVRNPSSSIHSQGYGHSELEMLANVVTALLWGFQYNMKFFSQGSTPKGILNFKGQIPGKQLAAFRRFFYQMLAGVENAWKTPILNADDGVEWVSMQSNNRDMEYNEWMNFLLKLACAMFLMDPAEVNFKFGSESEKALFESSNQQKVTASKDRGLKPILRSYADGLNRYIVYPANDDFELRFLGLDAMTPKEQVELYKEAGQTYLTVNEIRELEGKNPLQDGDVILSPTYIQMVQARQGLEAEAAAQAEGETEEVPADATPEATASEGEKRAQANDDNDLGALLAKLGTDDSVQKSLSVYEV